MCLVEPAGDRTPRPERPSSEGSSHACPAIGFRLRGARRRAPRRLAHLALAPGPPCQVPFGPGPCLRPPPAGTLRRGRAVTRRASKYRWHLCFRTAFYVASRPTTACTSPFPDTCRTQIGPSVCRRVYRAHGTESSPPRRPVFRRRPESDEPCRSRGLFGQERPEK